jgi:putative chitinase
MQALDVTDPDYFSTVEGAVKSAIWFWKINMLSRERDLAVTTKRINGGLNGLDSRKAHLNAIKKAIFEKPKKDTNNAN